MRRPELPEQTGTPATWYCLDCAREAEFPEPTMPARPVVQGLVHLPLAAPACSGLKGRPHPVTAMMLKDRELARKWHPLLKISFEAGQCYCFV